MIEREIASRVGFGVGAVLGPDGLALDVVAACAQYEEAIVRGGGVDLQILRSSSAVRLPFSAVLRLPQHWQRGRLR